jgi:hypothetical protein
MWLWLAAASGAGIMALLLLRYLARRRAFGGRPLLPLTEIQASMCPVLSLETVHEVWTRLGVFYSLDPRLIRPTDPLRLFNDVDSWMLWRGTEALEAWIRSLELDPPVRTPETVYELAMWLATATRRHRHVGD